MKENLISSYIEKEELKIEKIVEQYYLYLYKIIKNMTYLLPKEDIEEVIMDVFLAIWNNKEKMIKDLPIEPYIIGITKNIIKNKYRKLYLDENIEEYKDKIEEDINIQLLVEQQEKNEIIKKALEKMKVQDKEIFLLYYYHAINIKQIANNLNMTQNNVKTRLHRIRKKIRERLQEGGYYYEK